MTIEGVENEVFSEDTTATEISSKVNVLQATQFVSDSWRQVTTETTRICFRHCGFTNERYDPLFVASDRSSEGDEPAGSLANATNVDEFVNMEGPCMADELLSGEEIVDEMIQERGEGSDCDDGVQSQLEPVTLASAIDSLQRLRRFSVQENSEDCLPQELNVWTDYLSKLSLKRSKQVTLDNFFVR